METITPERIKQLTLSDWQPCNLKVEGWQLSLTECLRLLPGKRIAARAVFDGRTVFAKVFFDRDHGRHARREMENVRFLSDAGVRVPAPVALLEDDSWSVLLMNWLDEADSLEACLYSSGADLVKRLLQQLNAMYAAGCYQADLHPDNFMIANDEIWVVDAGDVRALPAGDNGKRRLKIRNLALLCAQARLSDADVFEKEIQTFFRLTAGEASSLSRLVRKARDRRIRKANKKWLRACSAIERRDRPGEVRLLDRSLQDVAASLLSRPDDLREIKRGSRITVLSNQHWVVKHYRDTSLRARIKRWLGIDSARRSWVMGWTMSMCGVPTPRPAGWVSYADGSSLLLFPRIAGERLSEVMENEPAVGRPVAEKVRLWLDRFSQAGFWHGDMKAQNILLPDAEPWFIDLDAAGWSRFPARSRRMNQRDRRRFEANRKQFVPRS